ncbi:PAF15 factor, partial [Formicarius rufipectus]|nr:PAF15 factor [Formicarius rufipectus]NXK97080.1 PAF15 factor [Formicarius rufipectus]
PAVPAVLVARAPRKALGSPGLNAGSPPPARRGSRRRPRLNAVCVRPVPSWQRSIAEFLPLPPDDTRLPDGAMPGTSSL